MKRSEKVESIIPYAHKVLVTTLCIPVALPGACGVGGADVGDHEIPIADLSIDETTEIRTAFNANRGVYLTVVNADPLLNKVYRLTNFTEVAGVMTKAWVFPAVETAIVAADVINFGGSVEIDIGVIGDEGLVKEFEVENDDAMSETGSVVSRVSRITNAMLKSPTTKLNVENFLLMMPNSFFVTNDTSKKAKYGMKASFFEAVECKVKVVSLQDPTNTARWETISSALMSLTDLTLSGNKDRTKYFNVEFMLNSSDELITFGDTTAVNTPV
jgi:hypothetical protein